MKKFDAALIKRVSPTLILVAVSSIFYIYVMRFIDHRAYWISPVIVSLAFLKSAYFTTFTFRQMNISIKESHSFGQLLGIFGLLVFVIVFSFGADYTCLSVGNHASFKGLEGNIHLSYLDQLFQYFYFSTVTFASIGYGDIVPVSVSAKLVVIIEIAQSFITVVFGLSNINNIHSIIKSKRVND
ncbi:MAG: two pore domain potassium channel family protein [Cyclobacteriaceae bacterium]|nr:two pore domain potassium channel family protein [Bacteroidota bacterium]MBX2900680.1 two pore domain potassium channel family protein [Cyclobacteriaceae bacterium]